MSDRLRAVLRDHYLMNVICDEATKQDNPVCGCSRVFLGWHSSIGAAREAWIDHVLEVLNQPEPGSWIPADPDGLPPETYPTWRKQEMARREEP